MPQHTAVATLHTNHGDIVVNLFGDHAPRTVKNFVGLADGTGEWTDPATGKPGEGPLYDGVIFHRIIPGFMIQGGDPLGQGIGGPGYTVRRRDQPRARPSPKPYVLAMANAGLRRNAITGAAEGTNGSQFFITTDPTPWLQGKHTIFGEVADDASPRCRRHARRGADRCGRPTPRAVVIESIDVVAA